MPHKIDSHIDDIPWLFNFSMTCYWKRNVGYKKNIHSKAIIHIQCSLSSIMENIVGLIDMDGFRIQKQFLCKEFGGSWPWAKTLHLHFLILGSGGATSMKKMQVHVDILRNIFTSYPWAYRVAHKDVSSQVQEKRKGKKRFFSKPPIYSKRKQHNKGANIDRRLVPYHAKCMRIQSRIVFIYIYIFICINGRPFCDGVRRLGTG